MIVDTSSWNLRNVEALPSGELAARQALDNTVFSLVLSSSTKIFGGFTILNPTTDEVNHYIVHLDTTVKITILDDMMVVLYTYDYGTTVEPADVTYAVVENELIVACPNLPTLWGLVGSGLVLATSVDSVNPGTTVLDDVPTGLSVGWAGRCVIASREGLYFSDALAPRTFVGSNAVNPPGGAIYGLHVNKGGALIAVTSDGVYALPEDAAASGQIVVGIWSKLTDYKAAGFRQTASVAGRVFGLVEGGVQLIDDPGAKTISLDENLVPRHYNYDSWGRITFPDYRIGVLIAGNNRLYVTISNLLAVIDITSEIFSWWSSGSFTTFALAGILYEEGSEVFLVDRPATTNRLFVRNGNFNYANDAYAGLMSGYAKLPGNEQRVIRAIEFQTDGQSFNGIDIQGTQTSGTIAVESPIIGTDSWGSGVYREAEWKQMRAQCSARTNKASISISINEYPSRLPTDIKLTLKGPGKRRP